MIPSELVIWGIVIHLVCDWLLQNDWMARHKSSVLHPAAWVHSGIHFVGALLIFPLSYALIVGLTHILIDTRRPLVGWRRVYHQTTDPQNPFTMHVAIWGDQVAHIFVIALVALMTAA